MLSTLQMIVSVFHVVTPTYRVLLIMLVHVVHVANSKLPQHLIKRLVLNQTVVYSKMLMQKVCASNAQLAKFQQQISRLARIVLIEIELIQLQASVSYVLNMKSQMLLTEHNV